MEQKNYFAIALLLCLAVNESAAQVNEDDASNAYSLSKKYKDDDIMCTSSYHLFTFDKGKNALGDKVVEIVENSEF